MLSNTVHTSALPYSARDHEDLGRSFSTGSPTDEAFASEQTPSRPAVDEVPQCSEIG